MDVLYALRTLRRRWKWAALGLLPAAYLALSVSYHVSPSGLQKKSIEYGAAQGTLLVDSPKSTLASASADVTTLSERAQVFAQFMQTAPVLADIGRRLHLDPSAISVQIPNTSSGFTIAVPTAGQSNSGLLQESRGYQLEAVAQPNLPLIDLYTQGPTGQAAAALANASAAALGDYIGNLKVATPTKLEARLAAEQGAPPPERVTVTQIGVAQGGMVDPGTSKTLVALAFVALVLFDCVLVIVVGGFVDRIRAQSEIATPLATASD